MVMIKSYLSGIYLLKKSYDFFVFLILIIIYDQDLTLYKKKNRYFY